MEAIKAVLLEPVGCLAEFRPDEFETAAAELFEASPSPEATGSHSHGRQRIALVRVKSRPAYSHPYYWSAFAMVGR